MSGILSAVNPLNVVRRKVAPVLRQWEQERPNVVPGILAGALETAPIFAPTVGEMVGGTGQAILGSELFGAMQQMEADPTQRVDLMPGMMSSPIAYPMAAMAKVPDYGISHRPPSAEYGAPLHDLTVLVPDDVYGPNAARYYGARDPEDASLFRKLLALRGKPDELVDVYRAVPKAANASAINDGDWVTLSSRYAKEHGERILGGDYVILRDRIPAKALFTSGDSFYEAGVDFSVLNSSK